MHEHLKEEEERAAAKTRGLPAVGKRQGAPAPAASPPHARAGSQPGTEESQERLVCAAHPCAEQSRSQRLALCERGGCKKAISCHCHGNGPAAPGASRSHPSGAEQPSDPTALGAPGPELFPAAGCGRDPDSQPGEAATKDVFPAQKGFPRRFPSDAEIQGSVAPLRASVGLVSVTWEEQGKHRHDAWGNPADAVSRSQHGAEE